MVTVLSQLAAPLLPKRRVRASVPDLPVRDRCLVMGIVNVTPDSFSDGGAYLQAERAVEHGIALAAAGADLVDVGGESTRPGAARISESAELGRVLPVVRGLVRAGVLVTIDTMRAAVAEQAVAAGAVAVNDVSGGLADPMMATRVAQAGVPFIAMHWRGHSLTMATRARYDDVVRDVATELGKRVDVLVGAGISAERIVLDPGIGFAKDAGHNWELLARLPELLALGHPVLIGASRKAFLGSLLVSHDRTPPPQERDAATAAVSTLAAAAGAWCVRVHDAAATAAAVRVAAAWAASSRE